ncbi:MAG: acyl carrier protein [Rhizobiaceae bacterium]
MSNAKNARKLLAGALELPEQEVDSSTMIGVTQQWDSLAHMRLILALEEALGSELEMEAVVNIANLSDVETTLANAKA